MGRGTILSISIWSYGVVVSISGCDPLDPGSTPGTANFFEKKHISVSPHKKANLSGSRKLQKPKKKFKKLCRVAAKLLNFFSVRISKGFPIFFSRSVMIF